MKKEAGALSSAARRKSARGRAVRSRKLRVALYSHDTMGIGHMRRNALIAGALAGSPLSATMLMICGAREACTLSLPAETDCLTLPSYYKEADGEYRSRSLAVSREDLTAVRAQAIASALAAFGPDVLIVDKVPRGALGELEPALKLLHSVGRTRCILGLRDILDEPEKARRDWTLEGHEDAIIDYYDAVWIYGDPAVYDQISEYQYPASVAARMKYTGYLTRPIPERFQDGDCAELLQTDQPGRIFLCTVGGGQDGFDLTEAFAQVDFPLGRTGVIVTGPYVPDEVYQRLCHVAAGKAQLRVLKFVSNPEWLLNRADRVVAMGGYNTVCELLSLGKRALIVPRIKPRQEQWIRAERLRMMGLVDVLHPESVGPDALAEWLNSDRAPATSARERINFNGAANLPRFLKQVLTAPPSHQAAAETRTRMLEYAVS